MRIASFIDHTILKQTTTRADVLRLAEEALKYEFAAICVPPFYVTDGWKKIAGSPVKLATVVGFPFGYHTVRTKVEETRKAIGDGADEIDMVMKVAALNNGEISFQKK